MTVLLRSGILRLCAGAAGVLTFATTADAQRSGGRPCTAATTILIAFPKAPDRATGMAARDKVHSTFNDFKDGFCIAPKEQVDQILKGSSFAIDSVLGPLDLVSLSQPLRADAIVEFEVVPVGRSYQFSGRVILTRERQGLLRDSIPKHLPVDIASGAAKEFLSQFKKVLAVIELEKKCFNHAREERFAEAEAAGRQALASLTTSNIARMCLATVLTEAKKNPDEVVKLTDEVLATDPSNELALTLQLNTYLAKAEAGDKDQQRKYADVGGRIIAKSPTSPVAETIIANLASWKMTDIVIQLLDRTLKLDPDNTNLAKIEFRILFAAENFKEAVKKGEALYKVDTAVVDTAFVNRMVNAYSRDTQPQKAAEWLSRATSKWPDNIPYALQLAQVFKSLGQPQQAIAEYQRVLKLNPRAPQVRLFIVDIYNTTGQTDSAFAWARRSVDAGEDKAAVATMSVQIANRLLKAANDTTGGRTKSGEDFKKVIPYAAYADTLGDLTGRFLWGVAALSIGAPLLQAQQAAPTCAGLKEAREWIALANEKVLGGSRAQPQAAGTTLPQINQMMTYADAAMAALRPPCTN